MDYKERLRNFRGKKTRAQFAKELGISRSYYSRIESGEMLPSLSTLQKISQGTNSVLTIDLVPKETEQMELEMEEKREADN